MPLGLLWYGACGPWGIQWFIIPHPFGAYEYEVAFFLIQTGPIPPPPPGMAAWPNPFFYMPLHDVYQIVLAWMWATQQICREKSGTDPVCRSGQSQCDLGSSDSLTSPVTLTHLPLPFTLHSLTLFPYSVISCNVSVMTDFAAAQKRILERRAAREQALTAADRQHHETRSADLTRLPPSLRSYAFEFLNAWDIIRSPYGTSPAFRVGQVDAELLDEALLGLLKKQAGEGLKLFGAHLKDDWDAETTLLLRIVYWKLSIWDHGTSYGASLQGLKYIDARGDPHEAARIRKEATNWQRALYGLITVTGRYCWTRWEERLSSLDTGYDEPSRLIQRLSRLTTFLGTSHNIAAFISFLVFLYNGRYRTLTDRLLRLRLVPSSNQTSREVSFEWLNRQLVWHAFTEFLLFLLPLVGISRWRRWIARAWKKTKSTTARLWQGANTNLDDEDEDLQKGELAFLPERTCAICYQDQNPTGGQSEQEVISSTSVGANTGIIGSANTDITNPYQADPCGCIYCFVCLAQRIEAEEGEGWICLRCGEVVKECRPWHGDVVVRRSRESHSSVESGRPPSRRKSVMFDLQEEEKKQQELDEMEKSKLEAVDPMPMEEAEDSMVWSKLDGEERYDDGEAEEEYLENDLEGHDDEEADDGFEGDEE